MTMAYTETDTAPADTVAVSGDGLISCTQAAIALQQPVQQPLQVLKACFGPHMMAKV